MLNKFDEFVLRLVAPIFSLQPHVLNQPVVGREFVQLVHEQFVHDQAEVISQSSLHVLVELSELLLGLLVHLIHSALGNL